MRNTKAFLQDTVNLLFFPGAACYPLLPTVYRFISLQNLPDPWSSLLFPKSTSYFSLIHGIFSIIKENKASLFFLFFFNCVKFLGANFYLFIIFWPCCVACRILVPQPGIKPVPPAVEAPSLNHWTGEVGGTGWSPRTSLFCPHSLAKNVWLTDLMLYPPAELETEKS